MGFPEYFPWDSLEGLLDYRLSRSNRTFAEFEQTSYMEVPTPKFQKYREIVFASHSGKLELYSSILADLNFDPLPYYREGPSPND